MHQLQIFFFLPHSTATSDSFLFLDILATALISSKLDYCNSLALYKLSAFSLKRLQVVQNSLATVVVATVKRSDHVSQTLRHLH